MDDGSGTHDGGGRHRGIACDSEIARETGAGRPPAGNEPDESAERPAGNEPDDPEPAEPAEPEPGAPTGTPPAGVGSRAINGLDRILTLPNLITLGRLACLPVFLVLLFGRENRAAAGWLLGVLGMTDWVDGYLARRMGQTSNLGKVLDPVADRLLFFVGAGGILVDGSVPSWFAVTVLVREAVVGGTTVAIAALGARRIDVSWPGKAGTFLLMFAFPSFLGSQSTLSYAQQLEWLAWGTGVPGLALSLYAAAMYVPIARRALAEGRQAREAA